MNTWHLQAITNPSNVGISESSWLHLLKLLDKVGTLLLDTPNAHELNAFSWRCGPTSASNTVQILPTSLLNRQYYYYYYYFILGSYITEGVKKLI